MILAHFGHFNHKCITWISRSRKTPVIRNHIPVVSRRNAFITILVPKLVAMVTRICPLCTGVSHITFLIALTLWQNQTLHGYDAYNWSCGNFVTYLHILAKNWLPWQRSLDHCNQKCILWIGRPGKPSVISQLILVISGRNSFVRPVDPCLQECHRWIPW